MTEEGLNAALLRLQSLTIETYGRMKDVYRREQQEGDVDLISSLSMKLANYEGALLTLRQYKNDIIESSKIEEPEEDETPEDMPPPEAEELEQVNAPPMEGAEPEELDTQEQVPQKMGLMSRR